MAQDIRASFKPQRGKFTREVAPRFAFLLPRFKPQRGKFTQYTNADGTKAAIVSNPNGVNLHSQAASGGATRDYGFKPQRGKFTRRGRGRSVARLGVSNPNGVNLHNVNVVFLAVGMFVSNPNGVNLHTLKTRLLSGACRSFKPQRGKFTPDIPRSEVKFLVKVSNPNGVNLHIVRGAPFLALYCFKPQRGKFTHLTLYGGHPRRQFQTPTG